MTQRHCLLPFMLLLFLLSFPARAGEGLVRAGDSDDPSFKALTYNIHRGVTIKGLPSLERIARLLKEERADFIALQEVDRYRFRSGFRDQMGYLAEQLNMEHVFAPNVDNGISQYGNGILSRYPILEWGKFSLASDREPRSLIWAKVLTPKGNLYVTSIHLGLYTEKRREVFAQLAEFVKNLGDEPVLLMGDFNVLPSHPLFRSFCIKALQKLYSGETPTYYHPKAKKHVQIDYILGKNVWELMRYTHPSDASDHDPLVLVFTIAP